MLVACEQALHYLWELREFTREQHAKGDASTRGRERKGKLARGSTIVLAGCGIWLFSVVILGMRAENKSGMREF